MWSAALYSPSQNLQSKLNKRRHSVIFAVWDGVITGHAGYERASSCDLRKIPPTRRLSSLLRSCSTPDSNLPQVTVSSYAQCCIKCTVKSQVLVLPERTRVNWTDLPEGSAGLFAHPEPAIDQTGRKQHGEDYQFALPAFSVLFLQICYPSVHLHHLQERSEGERKKKKRRRETDLIPVEQFLGHVTRVSSFSGYCLR